MMKKRLLSACSFLTLPAIIGLASPADAQSMDYGSLSSLFGEPVTTSSTGTPQKASQVAANMTIITADDIRHNGSRSIPQLLAQVPGLDVSQISSVGFDVGVRGYQQQQNSRLLVLVDGRQVFQDDYSRTVWENLPVDIDDIRQIEVVIGPASALFGSNAVGGVINIVTYSPLYDRVATATLAAGSRQGRQGDAVVSQPFDGGKGGIKLSAGAANANEFTTNRPNANFSVTTNKVGPDVAPLTAAGPNTNDEWPVTFNPTHRYAAVTADYTLRDDLVAELSANYSRSHSSEANYIGQVSGLNDEVHALKAGFTWQTDLGTIKADSYWNHTRVNNYYASANYPYYADTTDLYVNQIEDQFRIGDSHTVRLFGEYRHTDFHTEIPQVLSYYGPEGVPSGVDDVIHENVFAAGGMWLWQITDDLTWTNAGRVDFFGLGESGPLSAGLVVPASAYDRPYKPAESANSGLVYTLTSEDTFHLTYGRAVEFPRLLDYGFNILGLRPSSGGGYRYVERVGNPALKPTIVTNYELDYDRKLPFIDSLLSASVYRMSNHSLLSSLVGLGNIGSSTLGSSQYDLGLGNAVSQAKCSPTVPVNAQPSIANGTPLLRCYAVNLGQSENIGSSSGTGAEIDLKGKNALGLRWDLSYSLASVSDSKDLYTTTVNPYGLAAAKGVFFEDSAPRHHGRIGLGYSSGDWEFDIQEQVLSDHVDLRFGSGFRQPVNGYNSLSARIGYKFVDDYTLSVSGTNLTQAKTQATAYPQIERSLMVALTGKF